MIGRRMLVSCLDDSSLLQHTNRLELSRQMHELGLSALFARSHLGEWILDRSQERDILLPFDHNYHLCTSPWQ